MHMYCLLFLSRREFKFIYIFNTAPCRGNVHILNDNYERLRLLVDSFNSAFVLI